MQGNGDNPTVKLIKEYTEALIVALVLALFIRTFVVQAFKIPSGSMLETLQIGDHLLVSKFLYGIKVPFTDITAIPISDPQHGDIIVFEYPEDPSKDFIKRIIGLPGDTVEVRHKVVYRNGEPLNEPYVEHKDPLTRSGLMDHRDNMPPIVVPPHKYFVMGDNRDFSHDSRFWGFVDRSAIIGKAWRIYWSWGNPWYHVRWDRLGEKVE